MNAQTMANNRCQTLIVLVLIGLCDNFLQPTAAGPIVTTRYGDVEGNRKLYNRQFYEEFLGIPFAAPPVDELRWKPPQPVEPWTGVLNATEYSQHCTQFIAVFYRFLGLGGVSGEDCLYINIYVPNGVDANQGRQLPVMVWIYGGAYIFGTGEMYPGYALALHGDVIVVNFNYRVSTLGWLSTGDDALAGNYGLWDVEAALVWVQENIASFGGDPTMVTVFGQSAGGALTSHAVISPKTRGLFNNAIAVSGASSGFFGVERRPLRTAAMLADVFNCTDVQTSADIVTCLADKEARALDFWGVVGQVSIDGRLPNFAPVIDGQIVPLEPSESWELGYGRQINFITGFAYQDAAGFVILNPIALPPLGDKLNVAATEELLMQALHLIVGGTSNQDELINTILERYPDMVTPDNFTRTVATTRAMTDWWFGSGSNWEAVQHATHPGKEGSTYHYQFHHRQSFLVGYPEWINGSHVDDIYSFLGEPFMQSYRRLILKADFDQVDKQISNRLMNYFSNFAHTGNPNEGPLPVELEWTEFDASRQNYLFEAPTFSMQEFDSQTIDDYNFWTNFVDDAEFPPGPSFPLPLVDEVETSYYFEDLNDRYHLTETDVQRGIERLRHWLHASVTGDDDLIAEIDTMIDEMVTERNEMLNRRQ